MIEVLVPEIAVAETVQHLSEVLEEHRGSLAKLNRERQQYGLAPVQHAATGDTVRDYGDRLRSRLKDAGAQVVPTPDIGQDELTRRAIQKLPPFDLRGRGFKDTLIWLTILSRLEPGEGSGLVSRDGDFNASDGSLLPGLRQELSDRGYGGMRLFEHVGAMVGELVTPLPALQKKLNQRLREDRAFTGDLTTRIEDLVRGRIVGYGPGPAQNEAIATHFDITNLDVTKVLPTTDSDRFYAAIRASGSLVSEYSAVQVAGGVPDALVGALVRLEAIYVAATGTIENLERISMSTVGWTSEGGTDVGA